ncbi:MAG: response regulator [Candidatus Omnitrophica bacterium]|nr:response regulator [Candidatus Omnitrophota bacterium]
MAKILIIDDELIICKLLNDVLKEKGYDVFYTLSGNEGIGIVGRKSIDIIIVDLMMPEIAGIQVLEEIKKYYPDAVVIVITGFPTFESVQAALKLGAYNYITKPFNIDEIYFVVERAAAFRKLTLVNKDLMKELEEHNVELEKKVRERTEELSLLYRIAQEISSSLKLEETLNVITNKVSEHLNLEICSILLLDKKNETLSIVAARGLSDEIVQRIQIKKGERISGWVVENNEAIFVNDIESDSRFSRSYHQEKYYTRSFISVPLVVKGNVIGVINANNKKTKQPLTENDFGLIKGIAQEAAIAIENARLFSSLEETYVSTVLALTSAIDAKDHYTNRHSQQVTKYGVAIAREMGLLDFDVENIKKACQLHDIGKIGVHDDILTKPGKLTTEEWAEIQSHATKSAEILKPLDFLHDVMILVEQHHESFDGSGYPYNLKGEKILLGARIMAVADSFDAMTSRRPYREALSKKVAIEELIKNKGSQFDPEVVDAFMRVLEKDPGIIEEKKLDV